MVRHIRYVVIVDSGAYSLKAGLHTSNNAIIVPNCITKVKSERRRPFIGDQMEECKDYSGLYYILPCSRGYIVNWDVQQQLWDYLFRTKLQLPFDNEQNYSEVGLIITEPAYNFVSVREEMLKMMFEKFGFGAVLISSAAQLAAFKYLYHENVTKFNQPVPASRNFVRGNEIACVVVDSGFSFTHVVPFVEGNKVLMHTKRVDIGGKAMTNYLQETISYRQLNMLEEAFVVNQMKEDCCFVSTDFWRDLQLAKKKGAENPIACEYVLPDYTIYKRGFIFDPSRHLDVIHEDLQRVRMNNERFQIPEMLFNPGDVNVDQIGLVQALMTAVHEFNPHYQPPDTRKQLNELGTVANRQERPTLKDIDTDEEDMDLESDEDDDEKSKENENNKDAKNESPKMEFEEYQDENVQEHLLRHILLIGGNCLFPHMGQRIYNELRSMVECSLKVQITLTEDPIGYAWKGGQLLCSVNENGNNCELASSLFHQYAVSRQEYDQLGVSKCAAKLANYHLPTFASSSSGSFKQQAAVKKKDVTTQ